MRLASTTFGLREGIEGPRPTWRAFGPSLHRVAMTQIDPEEADVPHKDTHAAKTNGDPE